MFPPQCSNRLCNSVLFWTTALEKGFVDALQSVSSWSLRAQGNHVGSDRQRRRHPGEKTQRCCQTDKKPPSRGCLLLQLPHVLVRSSNPASLSPPGPRRDTPATTCFCWSSFANSFARQMAPCPDGDCNRDGTGSDGTRVLSWVGTERGGRLGQEVGDSDSVLELGED